MFICFVVLLSSHRACSKKLEATASFDVKPSGQIAHQTIELVAKCCNTVSSYASTCYRKMGSHVSLPTRLLEGLMRYNIMCAKRVFTFDL